MPANWSTEATTKEKYTLSEDTSASMTSHPRTLSASTNSKRLLLTASRCWREFNSCTTRTKMGIKIWCLQKSINIPDNIKSISRVECTIGPKWGSVNSHKGNLHRQRRMIRYLILFAASLTAGMTTWGSGLWPRRLAYSITGWQLPDQKTSWLFSETNVVWTISSWAIRMRFGEHSLNRFHSCTRAPPTQSRDKPHNSSRSHSRTPCLSYPRSRFSWEEVLLTSQLRSLTLLQKHNSEQSLWVSW